MIEVFPDHTLTYRLDFDNARLPTDVSYRISVVFGLKRSSEVMAAINFILYKVSFIQLTIMLKRLLILKSF